MKAKAQTVEILFSTLLEKQGTLHLGEGKALVNKLYNS